MKITSPTLVRQRRAPVACRALPPLLLLVILPVAFLSSIPHVVAITEYTLVEHKMCKLVTDSGLCQSETHAFDAKDRYAYVFFRLEMGETGTLHLRSEWYYQSDSIEKFGSWDPYSVDSGDIWWFSYRIHIRDDKADLRGFWRVQVYIEDNLLFSEYFAIGPYYEVRAEMKGPSGTVSIPMRVDGKSYGEIKGGEVKKLGFAPGASHTLSLEKKEVLGDTGVRYVTQEDTWEFSGEGSHFFSYAEQYQLTFEMDPSGTATISGAGWYDKGATASLGQNPEVVAAGEGTQFARRTILLDDQEVKTAPTSVAMDRPHTIKIQYQKQYYLKIVSSAGNPQGEGWYDERSSATFLVTSPWPVEGFLGTFGGKYVFDHWSGDSTSTATTASVVMDGPKTARAEWHTDNTMPYATIGAIVAAVIIIVVALIFMRRRKAPTPAPTYLPPPAPPFPPPPPPVTPTPPPPATGAQRPTGKFCISCGAALPVHATFCNKCGSKQ